MRKFEDMGKDEDDLLRMTQFAVDNSSDAVFWVNADGRIIYVNNTSSKMLGYTRDELLNLTVFDINPREIPDLFRLRWEVIKEKKTATFETELRRKNNSMVAAEISINHLEFEGKECHCAFVRDITHRVEANQKRVLTAEVLQILNNPINETDVVKEILVCLKKYTGFTSIGIRLKQGKDFPYYATSGFSEEFLEKEKGLCTYDKDGNIVLDEFGNPCLECLCGIVLSGKACEGLPPFTSYGSFWTNSTSKLSPSINNLAELEKFRTQVIAHGYESVALIPLRHDGEIFGLLQLNDRKEGVFTAEGIEFYEGVGESIGIALARKKTEEELSGKEKLLSLSVASANFGTWFVDLSTGNASQSLKFAQIFGYDRLLPEWNMDMFFEHLHEEDLSRVKNIVNEVISEKRSIFNFECRILRKDRLVRWISVNGGITIRNEKDQPESVFGLIEDITGRKLIENIQYVKVEMLHLLNNSKNIRDVLRNAVLNFRKLIPFEAVGARFRQGDDFPYYETYGFTDDFILKENKLCLIDEAGEIICDTAGNPVIECMCGNILCGCFDPGEPFFTVNGSFWTNNTSELLSNVTEENLKAKMRNRCNEEGYESLALIPIRLQGETYGLFQFCDKSKGYFNPEIIAMLEELTNYVAISISKIKADDELKQSEQRYRSLFEESSVPIWEEDFSEVKRFFDKLTSSGVKNFRSYLEGNPKVVRHCAKLVKIIDVNSESLSFFGVSKKEDISLNLAVYFSKESFDVFREEIIALAEGHKTFESEVPIYDLAGNVRYVFLKLSVVSGFEKNLERVHISFIDITERKKIEDTLLFLAKRSLVDDRRKFFNLLATHIGETLGVSYVFIDSVKGNDDKAQTIVLYAHGKIIENIEYALKDTPCENVVAKTLCYYPDGIQMRFPRDELLNKMSAESYAGIPLWNSRGKCIGLLGIIDVKPLKNEELVRSLLQIVAVRVSGELEEMKITENLRESSLFNLQIIESAQEGVIVYGRDLKYRIWNKYMEELTGYSAQDVLGKFPSTIFPFLKGAGVINNIKKALKGDVLGPVEFMYPSSKTDETGWASAIYSPLKNMAGQIIGAIEIVRDITEWKRSEEKIQASREQLRALNRRNLSVREEERKYISREIHDEFGQILTSLKMDIYSIFKEYSVDSSLLKKESQKIDDAIGVIRKISKNLRPHVLDDFGLNVAIDWLASEFTGSSGIKCEFTSAPLKSIIEPEISMAVYRICQEALTNIVRHANATMVEVILKETKGKLILKVKDNGIGISKDEIENIDSLGLAGIRERVYSFGGNIKIKGGRKKGTLISIDIPINCGK